MDQQQSADRCTHGHTHTLTIHTGTHTLTIHTGTHTLTIHTGTHTLTIHTGTHTLTIKSIQLPTRTRHGTFQVIVLL